MNKIKIESNYQLKDTQDPNWDWVFVQKISSYKDKTYVFYLEKGGYGPTRIMFVDDFLKLYRRMSF